MTTIILIAIIIAILSLWFWHEVTNNPRPKHYYHKVPTYYLSENLVMHTALLKSQIDAAMAAQARLSYNKQKWQRRAWHARTRLAHINLQESNAKVEAQLAEAEQLRANLDREGVSVSNFLRTMFLAQGFLNGVDYRRMEAGTYSQPKWEEILEIAERYGHNVMPVDAIKQRYAEWMDAAGDKDLRPKKMPVTEKRYLWTTKHAEDEGMPCTVIFVKDTVTGKSIMSDNLIPWYSSNSFYTKEKDALLARLQADESVTE